MYYERQSSRYRKPEWWNHWYFVAVAAVLVIAVLAPVCSTYYKHKNVTAVVTHKERVCDGGKDGSCKYLVYTQDHGTFRLTDSLVIGRFNTSDLYGQIKPCHRYHIEYYGFRFGPTSSYPNIVKLDDKGKVDGCDPS